MIWARWAGVMGVPMKWEIARIFVVGTAGSGFCVEAAPSGVVGLFMAVAPYSSFRILLLIVPVFDARTASAGRRRRRHHGLPSIPPGSNICATPTGCSVLFDSTPLRSTTAELIRVTRHKFANAHRGPVRQPLYVVCHPVIPALAMQLAHLHEVVSQVLRHFLSFQLPFPFSGGNVKVRDFTAQRVRKFPGDPVHVLRTRTGKL